MQKDKFEEMKNFYKSTETYDNMKAHECKWCKGKYFCTLDYLHAHYKRRHKNLLSQLPEEPHVKKNLPIRSINVEEQPREIFPHELPITINRPFMYSERSKHNKVKDNQSSDEFRFRMDQLKSMETNLQKDRKSVV